MTDRDRERLVGVHPALAAAVEVVLGVMARTGRTMFVVEGLRTAARQAEYWAKGRTVPGPHATPTRPLGDTVTNADGVERKSNHQAAEDGLGYAVDLAFVGPDPFAETHPWSTFGDAAKDAGLRWGGDFIDPRTGKKMRDNPHVELRRRP